MTRHELALSPLWAQLVRVVFLVAVTWLIAAPVHAQLDLLSQRPEILVVDAVVEYAGPAGAPFEAPAPDIVPRLKSFWSITLDRISEKGRVLVVAKLDGFGNISDVSLVTPSAAMAVNAAALDALNRLKQTPSALAAYPPNRRRLLVTFYYNEASIPGPVDRPVDWPPRDTFRTTDGVTPPKVLREVKPQYTALAMQAKIQGRVLLESVVKADGSVGDTIVVRSLDRTFGLDHAAILAARHWQFEPGTRMGRPAAVVVTIDMAFTLK